MPAQGVKMKSQSVQKIEARIHEIDELLEKRPESEMTEGWLSNSPETAELAELYRERERLIQQLAKAA